MFNPSRLKIARLRKGLSLTKLAESSGVSLRSLTSYENSGTAPSTDVLEKLAAALAVPVDFFSRDSIDPIPVPAASFRKLSKTSAGHRDAALANAALTLEFFEQVESRFRLPDPAIPSLDKMSPEEAASVVRQRWNLSDRPVSNLLHLLESKGVRVAALGHEFSDIDAFCFWRDGTPYMFLNTSKSGERLRFDAAHELGHLVLHGEVEMDPSTSRSREAEANAFAANLLMPRTGVMAQSMRGASVQRILRARTYWKVSAMAMTHRLHELGLLSAWQYRTTCVTLSEQGFRSSEPGGIVPETSQLLRKVLYGHANRLSVAEAAELITLYPDEVRSHLRNLVPISA